MCQVIEVIEADLESGAAVSRESQIFPFVRRRPAHSVMMVKRFVASLNVVKKKPSYSPDFAPAEFFCSLNREPPSKEDFRTSKTSRRM
jgi:hypothetical protein